MLFRTKFAFHTRSAESLTIREGLFSDPFRPMIRDSHHFLRTYRRPRVFSFQNHVKHSKTLNSIPALSGQSESVYMYASFPSLHGSQHQLRKAHAAEASSQLWRSQRLEHFVCKLYRGRKRNPAKFSWA